MLLFPLTLLGLLRPAEPHLLLRLQGGSPPKKVHVGVHTYWYTSATISVMEVVIGAAIMEQSLSPPINSRMSIPITMFVLPVLWFGWDVL